MSNGDSAAIGLTVERSATSRSQAWPAFIVLHYILAAIPGFVDLDAG